MSIPLKKQIMKSMPDQSGIFKNKIITVLLAVGLAFSTAGCNGKIFNLFIEDDMLNNLIMIGLTSQAVLTRIEISPNNRTIAAGFSQQYYATGIYSDNTVSDITTEVTWSLEGSLTGVSIDGSGLVTTGVTPGNITVRADYLNFSDTADLTVSAASLEYITITAADSKTSIANGTTLQFTAIGTFSDNSTQDITEQVTWNSSIPGNVSINSSGIATGQAVGSSNITANNGVTSNTYALSVTAATLSSLSISPTDPIAYVIAFGTTQQFTCTGTFSDSTTQDMTGQVEWSSSDTDVATINTAGLAITQSTGNTVITGGLPFSGPPYTTYESTTLSVRQIALRSIAVSPSTLTLNPGQAQQYQAMGTFADGTVQDLTSQVTWSSDDTNLAVIENGGTPGLVTALIGGGGGSVVITAQRSGITGTADLTVNAADTQAPVVSSARLLPGNKVEVTFSEPMLPAKAMTAANYKVLLTTQVVGVCTGNANFTGSPASNPAISSVSFLSQSKYILNLSTGTSAGQYTVIVTTVADAVEDLAGNDLSCPNTATFTGIDTIPPYMVSVINSEPTKIIVKFSEPMLNDGSANAADTLGNYAIAEDPSDGNSANDVVLTGSVDEIDSQTYQLTLDKTAQSIQYKLTVAANVVDQAVTPNPMGTPRFLTFTGNEQLKMVSALATDTTHIKVTFSKPVQSGDGAGGAECSDTTTCHTKYKLFPRHPSTGLALLGDITSAVRGSSDQRNTVVLTHSIEQEGIAYVVVAANQTDGDGFDNGSNRIQSEASSSDYVQTSPKDRASFVGKGNAIDEISDGFYFNDPFADGTSFNWSFVYANRVYLATNDNNTGAFRFDPDGFNSVLVTFDFSSLTSLSCPSAPGFGYIVSTIGAAPTCGVNSGPDAEVGVVGFNAIYPVISGNPYELLVAGPLKDNVDHIYYTQDLTTELNWKAADVTGTNGINSKSIQTIYSINEFLFTGISSNHNTNLPILNRYILTESGGVVTVGTPYDVTLAAPIDDPVANGDVAGIDSIIVFRDYLYLANNGGVTRVASGGTLNTNWDQPDTGLALTFSWTDVTPTTGFSGTTLYMPAFNTTDGGGLGKVSPGQKGYPIMIEYNNRLYLARNVASGSGDPANKTISRPELWKCTPGTTGDADACDAGDWTKIISGSETDLPNSGSGCAISLLQNSGTGTMYVGFDSASGATVWRISSTNPLATTTTMADAGWSNAGAAGLYQTPVLVKIYSSTYITDGLFNYMYMTAGDGVNAIKVFRMRE